MRRVDRRCRHHRPLPVLRSVLGGDRPGASGRRGRGAPAGTAPEARGHASARTPDPSCGRVIRLHSHFSGAFRDALTCGDMNSADASGVGPPGCHPPHVHPGGMGQVRVGRLITAPPGTPVRRWRSLRRQQRPVPPVGSRATVVVPSAATDDRTTVAGPVHVRATGHMRPSWRYTPPRRCRSTCWRSVGGRRLGVPWAGLSRGLARVSPTLDVREFTVSA